MLRALMRRLRHGSDGQDEFVGDVTGCEDLTTTAGPVDAVDAAAATATAVASTVMSVECIILQALEHQKVVAAKLCVGAAAGSCCVFKRQHTVCRLPSVLNASDSEPSAINTLNIELPSVQSHWVQRGRAAGHFCGRNLRTIIFVIDSQVPESCRRVQLKGVHGLSEGARPLL
jgi:hypothetical protein